MPKLPIRPLDPLRDVGTGNINDALKGPKRWSR
ncbi:MAG: hypothetical protein ACI90E_001652, partial [Yoonia sp.]